MILFFCILLSCTDGKTAAGTADTSWDAIKANTSLSFNTAEYQTPFRQNISNAGWEDGIYISRDGLHLYCTYVPGDLLSWTLDSSDPSAFSPYLRGPDFGMDMITNPAGKTSWAQADILHAQRSSIVETFGSWSLSAMARAVFSEGAVVTAEVSGGTAEFFLFTSNDKSPTYDTDIWAYTGSTMQPSGTGSPLAGFPHTTYTEDNPHIERISTGTLVLFFDSNNYPGGNGSHDIWYSLSTDNAASWSTPLNLSSVNTVAQEHQPHLFNDGSTWWLYFSAMHTDGKLGIFRARQQSADNWNDWSVRELVIGAGNSGGVGEPTLTSNGDISFVVVYEKPDGAPYNRFDADPWFMKRK